MLVDRLENDPVGIQMHVAVSTFPAHREEFGGAIAVAHRAAQRLLDPPAHRRPQRLATGPEFARPEPEGAAPGLVCFAAASCS